MAPQNYDVGVQPLAVEVADFNNDGIPDLAVADTGSNDVSVLLGNGDGTFAPAVRYGIPLSPSAMALGDFNGDGNLDLVVLDGAGHAGVLFGNGDGTFANLIPFTVDSGAVSVAAADVTGDGTLDLVLVAGGNTVEVLPGNGDGSFGPPTRYSGLGVGARSVVVGDVNGDGTPDLVVASIGNPFGGHRLPGGVSVLLGNGDGTFSQPVNYTATSIVAAQSVVLADLNGDGALDIITGNVLFLGNGDGSFGPANYFGGVGDFVAVGDFNGDGIPDLAEASGDVQVFLGQGDGTFPTTQHYAVGRDPMAVAVADVNGDSFPDLITANYGSDDVTVLLNAADWDAPGPGMPRPGSHRPSFHNRGAEAGIGAQGQSVNHGILPTTEGGTATLASLLIGAGDLAVARGTVRPSFVTYNSGTLTGGAGGASIRFPAGLVQWTGGTVHGDSAALPLTAVNDSVLNSGDRFAILMFAEGNGSDIGNLPVGLIGVEGQEPFA